MRGFSPLINVVLTCLAAIAVVPVLGLPWFAGAIDSNDGNQGQTELMGEALARWFGQQGTTSTGTEVLAALEMALLAVTALTALLALAMLVPGLRSSLRGTMKLVPLAAPLIVLVALLAESSDAGVEPRFGAFVALALTVFMASAGQQAGEMREPKPAPTKYTPGPGRAF